MASHDFIECNEGLDSDIDISDDDSDYLPSSDSDTGDEIAPSPAKKKRAVSSKQPATTSSTNTARKLFETSNETTESEDDIPLARLRNNYEDSSDDETLAHIQQSMKPKDNELLENELARCLDQPMWVSLPFEQPDMTFKGLLEIPTDCKEPIAYFRELIPREMVELIAEQTNLYSVQKDGKSMNTSAAEIDLFIGLYLRMGLMQAYAVRAFWAENSRWELVADFMPRNRFEKLASTIHFINNMAVSEDDKADKLYKLRPWLKCIENSLAKLPQEEHSSVDEIMIPFKGKSGIKQYMRNKPHKWGFKLWGRAGASGQLLEFEVYQGAESRPTEETHFSKTTATVLRMTSKIPEGQNYKVFADNLFTSIALVNALKERGIHFTGTVRMNRLKGCNLMSEKELKKAGRGSMDSKVEVNTGTTVVRWYDNRTVDLLSTHVGVEPLTTITRFDKKQKKKIQVPCPAIIKEYNRFMGGVDLHDSLTALYRFPIKSKRWYLYIFFYTTNMMVVNTWLRHRSHSRALKLKPLRLAEFQGHLARQLVAPKAPIGRPRIPTTSPRPTMVYHRKAPARETRLDGMHHLPEWSQSRGRCKGKDCSALTYVKCSKCQAFLCFNKDRNCFAKTHVA